ncbi:hypothetical protein H074_02057 [Amycolatopsis decaplanina DSM 44594]|uniref:Uncharacterized protein n=1 Tax=Amycolatopsis decaplanina DSM 44594 TaxID=1284240 RepID=M2XUQ2_9PSEU|nr:hypothetical protein H074_02057 [Amycolatopsis decaplanina DSM 44594]
MVLDEAGRQAGQLFAFGGVQRREEGVLRVPDQFFSWFRRVPVSVRLSRLRLPSAGSGPREW